MKKAEREAAAQSRPARIVRKKRVFSRAYGLKRPAFQTENVLAAPSDLPHGAPRLPEHARKQGVHAMSKDILIIGAGGVGSVVAHNMAQAA